MINIQGVKIGSVVNISINGKLYKKNCGSVNDADQLFKLVLKAKANPTEDAVKLIKTVLNEKLRVALLAGIDVDLDTGDAFLAGFNTPIPDTLLSVIKDYHENQYPLEPIINFWKLLMINPDTRVRTSLFDFINTHDFVLTDNGYMVVYKSVYLKENIDIVKSNFEEFISNKYLHVKKTWKTNPNRYVVFSNKTTGELSITKLETAQNWDEKVKGIEIVGKLGELYDAIISTNCNTKTDDIAMYTDMHTRKMSISLGKPVVMERHECDSDPTLDCSYGLHVGATKYVQSFANNKSVILACFVNPANVVAVPEYDHSKMRVTEYFPFAVATYTNGRIDIIEQKYYEDDYQNYEVAQLETLVEKIIEAEKLQTPAKPIIETAIGAEDESRSIEEMKNIIELRLFDITK